MKKFLVSMALGATIIGLSACNGNDAETPVENADPDAPAGISVENARLILPPVSGNPAAAYFDITNNGEKTMVIRAVSVAGAESAAMHQVSSWEGKESMDDIFQLNVPIGETVKFTPGERHVMVMGLADNAKAGDEIEVTLTFAGGDKISFPAEIHAAGDDREADE
ncbi:copper chaperone PCu(A)C [Altericroceibacterium spongiae]|uniref:Copper chaperone PCu(A)C n=1 Tax=Altericroceibacterium spongiae TaxID=2320269 RepID=A0A420ES32_9SPHN|nr:copper chaperone PCu(A)C [Altericroceibacterium spongiae]RKF23482.1 copper chaperone PCu(A)C [Altericroceibacterium spongiae]